jgi:hypothetical protein
MVYALIVSPVLDAVIRIDGFQDNLFFGFAYGKHQQDF